MDLSKSILCYKMSGAGNTFVLIDAKQGSHFKTFDSKHVIQREDLVKKVCSSVEGVSADGVLFISEGSGEYDFVWDFFNSDGSTAEMCGNAARCAALFCKEILEFKKSEVAFKTGAGVVTASVFDGEKVRVCMPDIQILQRSIVLKTHNDVHETFCFVNTGVPHLVQKIHKISDAPNLKEMAREVRSHYQLAPAGANVTFYLKVTEHQIEAITYERGVEDYTLACGTGAVAAALVHSLENAADDVEVSMPGGVMHVEFQKDSKRPYITGNAKFIAKFYYNLED